MYWTIAANIGIIALIVLVFITMIATWVHWDDQGLDRYSIAIPIVITLIWIIILVFGIPTLAVIDSPH